MPRTERVYYRTVNIIQGWLWRNAVGVVPYTTGSIENGVSRNITRRKILVFLRVGPTFSPEAEHLLCSTVQP